MARPSHRGLTLEGRDEELAALTTVVHAVRRGGRIAVVEGEAGIGKTRLVDAALDAARAGPASVIAARAEELDSYRPFAAIVDCAADAGREWRERVDAHLRAWDIGPDAGAERQFRVAETVLELLDERCARGPVVLAIEDLHWCDPATLGVLARVAAGIERMPVALLVSARPQPRRPALERLLALLASRGAETVRVGPLDERASLALLEALVAARPGRRLAAQTARAAGNPLFLCELVAALEANGALVRDGGAAEVAVAGPVPSLPVTILHGLSFLAAGDLELLTLASALGRTFAVDDLARLAQRPVASLVPALRSAQRAGVLAAGGERLAFRHELVRDALYEDMPLSLRRGLHRDLADTFAAAGEPPERVAEHLVRAATPGDERDVAALVDVARSLVGRHPAGAADLFRQAVALSADRDARAGELEPELAKALVSAGTLEEAEDACRAALGRELDADTAAGLRLQLVMLLTRRGRTADAIREGLAARGVGERDGHRLAAWIAMSRAFEGQLDLAVREATAVLDASSDEPARALATNTLAMAAAADGRFAEAVALVAPGALRAERLRSREAHDARHHMLLGLMLTRLDRLDEAVATIERGRRAAEALGLVDAVPVYHYQSAFVAFLAGRLDDALAELAAHAQLAEGTAIGWRLPAESVRAMIALHRDDLIAAERHVAAAASEAGAPPFETGLLALARGRLLEASGDAGQALPALAKAFAASATFRPLIGPELARLAAAAGEPQRAAAVPMELRRIAELNRGVRGLEAGALRARGLLEGDAAALVAAVGRLDGTGRVLEHARAAEDAAAAVGGAAARALLAPARAAYERAGATRDLARVDAAQRALGVRRGITGPRRRPPTGWDALTDTELRVVRLVVERLTNREIAERMFISRRTVQTHVSHVLAKLGVDSRRALAAEAARHAGWRLRLEGVAELAQQPEPAVEAPHRHAIDGDGA